MMFRCQIPEIWFDFMGKKTVFMKIFLFWDSKISDFGPVNTIKFSPRNDHCFHGNKSVSHITDDQSFNMLIFRIVFFSFFSFIIIIYFFFLLFLSTLFTIRSFVVVVIYFERVPILFYVSLWAETIPYRCLWYQGTDKW